MRKQNSRRRNRTIYTLLILGCIIGFWVFENFYTPATYSSSNKDGKRTEVPVFIEPGSTTGIIIKHSHFWLSYNEYYEQAEWVAYRLDKEHLTYDDRERPYYIEDPLVKSKSADWRNYKGSGYDRGHLCPAGDRRFSEYAYNETFYTSNISPQDRDFNAGVWNRLEMKVRSWCKKYGTLYIVTGGILRKGLREIGDEDVAIPEAYYKIVARGNPADLKMVAFIIPNRETSAALEEFLVPVDRVERVTGIDFFEDLSDTAEEQLENSVDKSNWKF